MSREWQVHVFQDLGYVVRAAIGEQNDCYVDVEVFELLWVEDGKPSVHLKDWSGPQDSTTDLDQGEHFLAGSIKWDGCSNLSPWDGATMWHFCGKSDAVAVGELLGRVYDIAHGILPRPDWERAS